VGVTNDLVRRIYEHKNNLVDGFTAKYNVHKLVYYDYTEDVISAITSEKQIKGWTREKKIKLIESMNPDWKDLWSDLN
jgi:putative endonuclease